MTTATATCEGHIGYVAGEYRLVPVPCGQSVALKAIAGPDGTHHACIRHVAEVRARVARMAPPRGTKP